MTASNSSIRVRFAPSPTGFLHIGGARTALFNWLFARHMKGTFILRIEDTDEVRSTQQSVQAIFDGMKWLGLDWDEGPMSADDPLAHNGNFGPYFQMQRIDLYKKTVEKLVSEGKAYPCYCTQEEVDKMREKALALKKTPKYDGTCRALTATQRSAFEAEGRKASVRFKSPTEGVVEFEDIIRGRMKFESELMEDFVILKTSGIPTYNFACVVDDHEMQITHVVRGDDHLSNTPRQVLAYKALGWNYPIFAHLSMILGPDGSRLSKRHGATSVQEYEAEGYLPEAVRNYLALLGWSTEESQDLFGQDELKEKFTLERCGRSPAIFDPARLLWMNGEYMRKLPPKELAERSIPFIVKAGLFPDEAAARAQQTKIEAAVAMEQEKVKLLTEVSGRIDIFFKDVVYDPESVEKVIKKMNVGVILQEAVKVFQELPTFTAFTTENACKALASSFGLKNGAIYHPVRVAVSGRTQGPSLFHMLELLGKEESISRMQKTMAKFLATAQ